MKLAEATWQEVRDFNRDCVVVAPTGSLEQHGPHLPLFTDSLLVTAVAEAVEHAMPDKVLLTPTLWLGASGHHLAFSGSLSASFEGYIHALTSVLDSLQRHGFWKFFVLNGHGGNNEPNGVCLRAIKERNPNLILGHAGYYSFIEGQIGEVLEGKFKHIRHACEAEASLMMHVRPDLVRQERLRDDGLHTEPPLLGMVHTFDEITEDGSLGCATLATADKGRRLFEAAVAGVSTQMQALFEGFRLVGD